jgi:hypothetical protein
MLLMKHQSELDIFGNLRQLFSCIGVNTYCSITLDLFFYADGLVFVSFQLVPLPKTHLKD